MAAPRRRAQNGPMDVKRISAADWLMIGGAVSTFVFGLFVDWAQYGHASGNNSFDYFLTGGIAWILAGNLGQLHDVQIWIANEHRHFATE